MVRAHAQGHGAGDNAVAFVQGRKLAYVPEPVAPLLFKHKDMEIQSVGPTAGAGLEEKVLTSDGETVYRSVFLENGEPSTDSEGILRAVQMIGSHEGFRTLLDSLGQPWPGGRDKDPHVSLTTGWRIWHNKAIDKGPHTSTQAARQARGMVSWACLSLEKQRSG